MPNTKLITSLGDRRSFTVKNDDNNDNENGYKTLNILASELKEIEPGAPILKRYIIKSYDAFVQIKDIKKFNAPFKEDHQLNKDIDKHLRNPTTDSFF